MTNPRNAAPLVRRSVERADTLRPAAYNPRKISKEALKGLQASIERWGVVQDIVVNVRNRVVIGGHQRLAALKVAGVHDVPVTWVDLDEADEKALNVALNNPHISGEFDDTLQDLLQSIKDGIGLPAMQDLKLDEGPLFHCFGTVLKELEVWRHTLVWSKSSIVLSRCDYHYKHEPIFYGWKPGAAHTWESDRKQSTVLEFDKPSRNGVHPTMKPVELVEYCIGNSSKRGDVVLDIFGGSGTTMMACERTGRKARLMELDPKYCDVIVKRWEDFTKRKAVLEVLNA